MRPDTVLTFGPDGFTGHPDHRAVSAWTDLAADAGRPPRRGVLHAVAAEQPVDPELDEDFGVFELGRPRICARRRDRVLLRRSTADALDRKVEALLRQESQTGRAGRGRRRRPVPGLGGHRALRRTLQTG